MTQRLDGRWQVQVDLGRGLNGRRRRKYVYAETQADAIDELRRLGGRAVHGQLLTTSTPTVGRYLEDWFATNSDNWRPSTKRSYRTAIDGILTPAFGSIRLESLSPQIIQRWLTQHRQEHGARRRIELAHAALRSALSDAQRLQIVSINAATLVKVPRPTKRTITGLDIDQAKTFLAVVNKHRLGALFSVALACGLRLGEATGLKWEDVDLTTGEVRIRQQLQLVDKRLVLQELKTAKSRRTLMLPDVCLQALKTHRTKQLEDRMKGGDQWVDTGLVFTTYAKLGDGRKVGGPLHPRNVLRALHSLLDNATPTPLPRMRFHDLRHSSASLLLAAGVDLAQISLLLGHSELRVTMDFYAHLQKQTAATAARRMDAVLKL